jgi:ribosomal protein L32
MSKCPSCGYFAFDGEACFDCGWRPRPSVYPGPIYAPWEAPYAPWEED